MPPRRPPPLPPRLTLLPLWCGVPSPLSLLANSGARLPLFFKRGFTIPPLRSFNSCTVFIFPLPLICFPPTLLRPPLLPFLRPLSVPSFASEPLVVQLPASRGGRNPSFSRW